MLGTQTTYPDFVPNQILTNSQLNDLREHLDQQDRATRSKLIGRGLICGFRWQLAGTNAARIVRLAPGLGLTSDGYIACLCDPTAFNRIRDPYADPGLSDNGVTPLYGPWRTNASGPQILMRELVSVGAGETPPDDTRILKQADLEGMVLVLYVELEPVELRSCFVTECDNKGQKVNVNLRAVLVREQDLPEEQPCEGTPDFFRVPRLHTVKPLEDVARAFQIDQGYGTIVRTTLPRLKAAIRTSYDKYKDLLHLDDTHIDAIENDFEAALTGGSMTQYHYDAVKDLATAYNEFVEVACGLVRYCCPPDDAPRDHFARHLMLGAFDDGDADYRHRFHPSPVQNIVDEDIERARKLFLRMAAIAKAVGFGDAETVRITPSHNESEPLGARALPHYFRATPAILDTWQPEACCTHDEIWSYHDHPDDAGSPHAHQSDTSAFGANDYNRCSLIRVEGHLHDKRADARQAILAERHLHNVEFDLLVCDFDDPTAELSELENDLGDLLGERTQLADAFNKMVANAVAEGTFPAAAIRNRRQQIDRLEDVLAEQVRKWISVRRRRRLHCDVSHLQTMYADLRAELLCLTSGLLVQLTRISEEVAAFEGKLPKKRGELTSEIVDLLKQQVGWLADVWLPLRLADFNYAVFIHRYKELVHDTTRFWLAWRSFGFPVHEDIEELEIPTPWPAGGEAISDIVLAFARGCFYTRFARLFVAFRKLWEEDVSYFPNLVSRFDGLEHIGGVRRCGTLVLVCDKVGNQATLVRADFSLSCRVPCCCEVDVDDLCLPLVALAGHRVVVLDQEDGAAPKPVDIWIDLSNAGYEPNFEFEPGGPEIPPIELTLPDDKTSNGGKLVELDAPNKRVRYVHERPRPGLIDSFEYHLKSEHRCKGEDAGTYLISMEPKPQPPPEIREPEEKPGVVCGEVTYEGKPFVWPGAVVWITPLDEDGEGGSVPVGPTAQSEAYYKKKLPAGRYELAPGYTNRYSHSFGAGSNFIGKKVRVTVRPGDKIEQDLEFVPDDRKGKFEVLIRDFEHKVPEGTRVVLRGKDVEFSAESEDRGEDPEKPDWHVIRDVPPGNYTVVVSADGFYSKEFDDVVIPPGEGAAKIVDVAPENHVIAEGFFADVAFEANKDLDKIRKESAELYRQRYNKRRAGVLERGAGNDNVADSPSYKRAVNFMKLLTAENVPFESVTRAYHKAAAGLESSIKRSPNDPDKRDDMRAVIREMSSAYLDRVSIEAPLEASPEVEESVKKVLKYFTPTATGATRTALLSVHNPGELVSGNVPVGEAMKEMMR